MIIKTETTSRNIALTYLDYIEIDNIISDCKQVTSVVRDYVLQFM